MHDHYREDELQGPTLAEYAVYYSCHPGVHCFVLVVVLVTCFVMSLT